MVATQIVVQWQVSLSQNKEKNQKVGECSFVLGFSNYGIYFAIMTTIARLNQALWCELSATTGLQRRWGGCWCYISKLQWYLFQCEKMTVGAKNERRQVVKVENSEIAANEVVEV